MLPLGSSSYKWGTRNVFCSLRYRHLSRTFIIPRILSCIFIWAMASHSSFPTTVESALSFGSSGYSYKIPEYFINAAKLPTRLDRLLGAETYTCRWRLNHYHILGAPRRLDEVSKQPLHSPMNRPSCCFPGHRRGADSFA